MELVWRENENGSESTGRDPLVRIKSCVSRVTGLRPNRLGCVLIGLLELEKELMRLFIDNFALVLLFGEGTGEGTTTSPNQGCAFFIFKRVASRIFPGLFLT